MSGTFIPHLKFHVEPSDFSSEELILDSLTENPLFGHTLGASGPLLRFISEMNKLADDRQASNNPSQIEERATDILVRLKQYHFRSKVEICDYTESSEIYKRAEAEELAKKRHLSAFASAVIIYFHQNFRESTPLSLATYVTEVMEGMKAFISLGGGNFTLWPVFIASVETYKEEDLECMRELLGHAVEVWMKNRAKALDLVERVWSVREATSMETGITPGMIKLDWRQIMHDLGMDILLI